MSLSTGHDDEQLRGNSKPPLKRKFKPKVKTGCNTCRVRRVKCDERRPACDRCLSTGRVCDGYPSVFRVVGPGASSVFTSAQPAGSEPSLSLYRPRSSIITADEIDKLAQFFHRKRRVSVSYQNEARAILANLTDPAIRHALDSLSALHDGLDKWGYTTIIDSRNTFINTERSLDAYNAAVSSLASRLREEPSRASARAALVCCQMFISIEVMIGDYSTAFQHLLLGLRIMYQYRNRPGVTDRGRVVPCHNSDFPHLDAFAIKLFASGYPGPRHLSGNDDGPHTGPMTASAGSRLCDQARADLSALSVQVLEFLGRLAELRSHSQVAELKMKKAQILGCLQCWEQLYFRTVREIMGSKPAMKLRYGTAFTLLLYHVLKMVVSLSLRVSAIDGEVLEGEFRALAKIASFATETRGVGIHGPKPIPLG